MEYWRLPNTITTQELSIVDVYFEEIAYTQILQLSAFTFESLVSSIGGALGLWTGASIITLIHTLYVFISFLIRKKQPNRRENGEIKAADELRVSRDKNSQNIELLL